MYCDEISRHFASDALRNNAIRDFEPAELPEHLKVFEWYAIGTRIAERFVLSPLVLETVNDLANYEAIYRSKDNLFFPAHNTWIEWDGDSWCESNGPMGMLFHTDDGNVRHGLVTFFIKARKHWAVFDKYNIRAGNIDFNSPGDLFRWMPEMLHDEPGLDEYRYLVAAWIGAALALINTPRIAEITDHTNEALNRRRARMKRPPFLSWKEVNIRVDKGTPGHGDLKTQTGEKAYHHVRAHMRIRLGKVELVKPHYRGNKEIGIIRHRYAVSRAEDEAGAWKGGPLPGPQIIKSRFEK